MSTHTKGQGRSSLHLRDFPFKVNDLVLVKWSDGMVYFAKIKRIDHKRRKCTVVFDDKSQDEAHFNQIHSVDETTTDIICIKCKKDNSESPNEIVLCDTCGIGYHQKCHTPSIPTSVLNIDTPWQCTYCSRGEKCPYLTESLDVLQNLLSEESESENEKEETAVQQDLNKAPGTRRSRRVNEGKVNSDTRSPRPPPSLEMRGPSALPTVNAVRLRLAAPSSTQGSKPGVTPHSLLPTPPTHTFTDSDLQYTPESTPESTPEPGGDRKRRKTNPHRQRKKFKRSSVDTCTLSVTRLPVPQEESGLPDDQSTVLSDIEPMSSIDHRPRSLRVSVSIDENEKGVKIKTPGTSAKSSPQNSSPATPPLVFGWKESREQVGEVPLKSPERKTSVILQAVRTTTDRSLVSPPEGQKPTEPSSPFTASPLPVTASPQPASSSPSPISTSPQPSSPLSTSIRSPQLPSSPVQVIGTACQPSGPASKPASITPKSASTTSKSITATPMPASIIAKPVSNAPPASIIAKPVSNAPNPGAGSIAPKPVSIAPKPASIIAKPVTASIIAKPVSNAPNSASIIAKPVTNPASIITKPVTNPASIMAKPAPNPASITPKPVNAPKPATITAKPANIPPKPASTPLLSTQQSLEEQIPDFDSIDDMFEMSPTENTKVVSSAEKVSNQAISVEEKKKVRVVMSPLPLASKTQSSGTPLQATSVDRSDKIKPTGQSATVPVHTSHVSTHPKPTSLTIHTAPKMSTTLQTSTPQSSHTNKLSNGSLSSVVRAPLAAPIPSTKPKTGLDTQSLTTPVIHTSSPGHCNKRVLTEDVIITGVEKNTPPPAKKPHLDTPENKAESSISKKTIETPVPIRTPQSSAVPSAYTMPPQTTQVVLNSPASYSLIDASSAKQQQTQYVYCVQSPGAKPVYIPANVIQQAQTKDFPVMLAPQSKAANSPLYYTSEMVQSAPVNTTKPYAIVNALPSTGGMNIYPRQLTHLPQVGEEGVGSIVMAGNTLSEKPKRVATPPAYPKSGSPASDQELSTHLQTINKNISAAFTSSNEDMLISAFEDAWKKFQANGLKYKGRNPPSKLITRGHAPPNAEVVTIPGPVASRLSLVRPVGQRSRPVAPKVNRTCALCGREATYLCSGCRTEWYCGRECQLKAWDRHSESCKS